MRHRENTIPIPAIGGLLALLFLGSVIMFARSDKMTTASKAPNGTTTTVPTKPATTTGSGERAH